MNPRLVEPGNAWRAGVDLVDALVRVSLGSDVQVAPPPRAGVRTHQLLLAVLGAAQHGSGRRGVARELALACARRGPYAGSAEELTPWRGDPLAGVPVAAAAIATLVSPRAHRLFTEGAVESYALTPEAWGRIASVVPAGGRSDVSTWLEQIANQQILSVAEPPTVHQLRGDGGLGDARVPEPAAQADRDDDEVLLRRERRRHGPGLLDDLRVVVEERADRVPALEGQPEHTVVVPGVGCEQVHRAVEVAAVVALIEDVHDLEALPGHGLFG